MKVICVSTKSSKNVSEIAHKYLIIYVVATVSLINDDSQLPMKTVLQDIISWHMMAD